MSQRIHVPELRLQYLNGTSQSPNLDRGLVVSGELVVEMDWSIAMQELKTRSALAEAFASAALIREVEERLLQLFAAGKLFGTVHTCVGQELVGVAIARALRSGDKVFSNHRCHGHFLARTGNVQGLIAEVMGKSSGVCGGRGGSQHLCDVQNGFFSNGVQGGIAPVSAGLAMSLQLQNRRDAIAVVFLGDGTLGEGAVYETLNLVSKWELPLLLVLENNSYAQSTPQTQTLAGSIRARAEAFAIPYFHGSTWAPERLLELAGQTVGQVRRERRPAFLEVDTYRLRPHSKGDDDRDREEIALHWARDPMGLFFADDPEADPSVLVRVKEQVDEAVVLAEEACYAKSAPGEDDLPRWGRSHWSAISSGAEAGTLAVGSIRDALRRNMERDSRIILIGEDIESPYGGAFKVTKGLSDDFPGRVRNTPISEATIVGIGNGLAIGGFLPVCEIMFGDFLTLAADQWINHASKFRYMYNQQVRVPLIVRTPMGGRRGYGPTHSQSLEKFFLGIPHTRVLALNGRINPGDVYGQLLSSVDRPTLVVENKALYGTRLGAPVPDGFVLEKNEDQFPTCRLKPAEKPQITVFCYGGMLPLVEQAIATAFDQFEILAEVICPTQLYPLNPWPVIESVECTGRLLLVEEGQGFAALGSELVAQIMTLAPGALRALKRLAAPAHPIPSCGPLETELLPNVDSILACLEGFKAHG